MNRRALLRLALGAAPVATLASSAGPCVVELDWVPYGQWVRHVHTDRCRSAVRDRCGPS